MPITASLGALSYAKTPLGDDYENWYMQTNSNVTFSSFTFDNESAFYVLGQTDGNTAFHVSKFKEYSDYPYTITSYEYLGSGIQGPSIDVVGTDIIYNTVDSKLIVVGYYTIPYWPVFPYDNTTAGVSFELPKTLDTGPFTHFQYLDWGNEPPSYDRYHNSVDFDTTNGNLYFAGYATSSAGGGPNTFYIRKKINIDSTGANTALTQVLYAYQSGIPIGTTSVKLDSSQDPIYCGITQATSTTNRRIVLRKASKTPVLGGPNYYLPTTWQRQLTLTLGLESKGLDLDSSDNIYLIAIDTTTNRSFIIKYNSSGTIQWQRRIDGVVLQGIHTDSSGNSYIVGQNTSNNLFIAKYDSSGTIQWQNKMSGVTYSGKKIYDDGTNLYVMGNVGTNGFMMKVPNDGSIPGTGTYIILGATITYSTATQSETIATLTDAASSEADNTQAPLMDNTSTNQSSASLSEFILGLS